MSERVLAELKLDSVGVVDLDRIEHELERARLMCGGQFPVLLDFNGNPKERVVIRVVAVTDDDEGRYSMESLTRLLRERE